MKLSLCAQSWEWELQTCWSLNWGAKVVSAQSPGGQHGTPRDMGGPHPISVTKAWVTLGKWNLDLSSLHFLCGKWRHSPTTGLASPAGHREDKQNECRKRKCSVDSIKGSPGQRERHLPLWACSRRSADSASQPRSQPQSSHSGTTLLSPCCILSGRAPGCPELQGKPKPV